MHGFFDYPFVIPFAHRGGDEKFPENTLEAFKHAYSFGYRYFETDVHFTLGQELVAFHDKDLGRMSGVNKHVSELSKAERSELLVNNRHKIPLLEELLITFPDVYFNIDAKSSTSVEPLVEVIKKLSVESRICLASFQLKNIQRLRQLMPTVPVIASRYEIAKLRFGSSDQSGQVKYLEIPLHLFYNKNRLKLASAKAIDKFHDSNCKVFVWTVNKAEDMQELIDAGVDGMFTDKITILKQVLQANKLWVDH